MAKNYHDQPIPAELLDKWQKSIDTLATIFEVNYATIALVINGYLKTLISTDKAICPPNKEEKILKGTFYEKVIKTGQTFTTNNAHEEIKWQNSPYFLNKPSHYIGTPVYWPEGEVFGSINLYDNKARTYSNTHFNILNEFKGIIEAGLELHYLKLKLAGKNFHPEPLKVEKSETSQILNKGRTPEYLHNDEIYRQIVENQNSLIVKFNLENKLTFVNQKFCKALNKSEKDLIGTEFIGLEKFDGSNRLKEIFEKLKNPPYECVHEEKVRTISGLQWFKWSNKSIINKDGHIDEIVSTGLDVTDRKKANDSLRKSESEFRKIIEMNAIPMVVTDSKQDIILFNKAFTNTFGYSIEDVHTAEKWFNTVYPDSKYRNQVMQEWNSATEEAILNNSSIKNQIWKPTCKNGNQKIVEFSFVSLGGQNVITMLDITEQKQAEEALILSEEKFKVAFKTSPDSININRLSDGLYIEINEGFTQLTGYTEEDIKGKTSIDLNLWANIEDRQKLVEALKNKGYCNNLEAKFKMKDGSIITGLMSATTIFLQNEPCILSITRNISKIKLAENELVKAKEISEKSERKYKDLFNEMHDGFALHEAIYDNEGNPVDYRFIDINPSYERLTGLLKENIIGKTILEVIPNIEPYWIINFCNVAKTGKPFHFENQAEDLGRYYAGIAYCPQKDYFAVIFSDVTEKKKAEKVLMEYDQKLKNQNEEYHVLNTELSELNKELTIAKEKVVESDKLKTSFLANMSHEIRTPMNGIVGFAGLLSKEGIDDEKRQTYVDIIQQNCSQLLTIINDLVDISKIEAGQIDIENNNVKLDVLTQGLHGAYLQKSLEKKIDFQLLNSNRSIEFITDEVKLRQILINLLDNAFKFTRNGNISFGYQIKGNYIEFFVKDTGIGLEKKFHNAIFERFRQVELSESLRYGGTGIGLSISKAYCEKMGGRIWLESEFGKGSVFYFTLPYVTTNLGANFDFNENTIINWSNKTILIAEDESVNYQFFEEIFEETNVNLIWAKNGQEAVDFCLKDNSIDLVLMDIKMPIMNGYDASKAIKKFRPNLPIIAQTAYALIGDASKAKDAGCDDYIHKPIDFDSLFRKIKNYFEK